MNDLHHPTSGVSKPTLVEHAREPDLLQDELAHLVRAIRAVKLLNRLRTGGRGHRKVGFGELRKPF
ncbi:hypothetical protein VDG1235_4162 [Verrucomicrobiia bacterium DG1235]|nr:hypothetical protein VDG1235_4162 [Verrucomicrobiae bacterium DG1235]